METNYKYNSKFFREKGSLSDNNNPFSYREWLANMQGVSPGQELVLYNKYLTDWFSESRSSVTSTQAEKTKRFLALLAQLQLFFSQEETENWYNYIDLTSEREIALAIPYFAAKLKEIALYYLRVREKVKQSKIHYNTAGSNSGLVLQLTDEILFNFTSKGSQVTLPQAVWSGVPALSAIAEDLQIELVEMYDDHIYQDVDPTAPRSAVTALPTMEEAQSYFSELGLDYNTILWSFSACTFSTDLTGSDLEKAISKYSGSDKQRGTVTDITKEPKTFDVVFQTGENTFFWPAYPHEYQAAEYLWEPTALSATGFDVYGTAGETLSTADTIFITTKTGLSGFWLQNNSQDQTATEIYAIFNPGENIFRYPYFGYGLSGEGIEWTGPSLEYDNRFMFLNKEVRKGITDAYWNPQLSLSATTPLYLNNTTLAEAGATPSQNMENADRIKVYNQLPTGDSVTFGQYDEAWMYAFKNTEIPIKANQRTVCFWPYAALDLTEDYPLHFPSKQTLVSVCSAISLSAMPWDFAVAGDSIDTATRLYPLNKYNTNEEDYDKCFWLSGDQFSYTQNGVGVVGPSQQGFNIKALPGVVTRFVWEGDDTRLSAVIPSVNHNRDCPYVLAGADAAPDKCSCHQVFFAPFGSEKSTFKDNNEWADYIFLDTQAPKEFMLESWRDGADTFLTSQNFAWFKTNTTPGWGDGEWKRGDGAASTFTLQKGKVYGFYRTEGRGDVEHPPLTVRRKTSATKSKWCAAVKDKNGQWVADDTVDAKLYPGDLFAVRTPETRYFNLSSDIVSIEAISVNNGSIWSIYDMVSIPLKTYNPTLSASYQNYINSIYVSWPLQATDSTDPQVPSIFANELSAIKWTVVTPSGAHIDSKTFTMSFVPAVTGVYTLSAYGDRLEAPFNRTYFTNIPAITAVNPVVRTPSLTAFETPAAGFTIRQQLSGWVYDSDSVSLSAKGAKPFWAKSLTTRHSITRQKGIESTAAYRFVESDLPVSLPELSPISLSGDQAMVYYKTANTSVAWRQDVYIKALKTSAQWCVLDYLSGVELSLSAIEGYPRVGEYLVATKTPANFTIEGRAGGKPTKIFYNAIESFTLPLSVMEYTADLCTPMPSAEFESIATADRKWNNLANRFWPTIALVPSTEDLYTADDVGLFTPSYLGMGVYASDYFTFTTNTTAAEISGITPTPTWFVGGRGVTRNDQLSPHTVTSDSILKNKKSPLSEAAGRVKNKVYKRGQKFIPYQSKYETTSKGQLGLTTVDSRQDPWSGVTDSGWGDKNNKPQSPVGELSVSKWVEAQVLKTTGMQLYSWDIDVYNNQYSLYKNLSASQNRFDGKEILGEMWVKNHNGKVLPAAQALSAVFDTHIGTPLYAQLTGTGIKNVSVFFDTLYIATSSVCLFEKVEFDYDTDKIYSLADRARYIALSTPPSLSAEDLGTAATVCTVGETWFFPKERKIAISMIYLDSGRPRPVVYVYDMNTLGIKKLFDYGAADVDTQTGLDSLTLDRVDAPTLQYDYTKKVYTCAFSGRNTSDQTPRIVTFTIEG